MGCEDFIEPNLEDDVIVLLAPPDQFVTPVGSQTFWWEELEGAETYNLQLVKGTFVYIQQHILDTSLTANKFQYSLTPGSYQWRVRGENNGGHTPYSTRTFTIDSSLDLSNQIVVLSMPPANQVTNETIIVFEWQSLYNAEEYRFQLLDSTSGIVLEDEILTGVTYTDTLIEGDYIWQVRAQNSTSLTPYTKRNLVIDLTAPSAPVLIFPSNNASLLVGNNDSLTWQVDPESVADSLYIDTDSTFANPIKVYSTVTYYLITQSAGAYFWKVKSLDAAGNQSAFSAYRKFLLQ
jgi:hypothetical protein